jgi:hypothetical protein
MLGGGETTQRTLYVSQNLSFRIVRFLVSPCGLIYLSQSRHGPAAFVKT